MIAQKEKMKTKNLIPPLKFDIKILSPNAYQVTR